MTIEYIILYERSIWKIIQSIMCNAQITSTSLGFEDHGILTCFLFLEFDGSCCGFGGYALDEPMPGHIRKATTKGFQSIVEIMKTVGVRNWEDLVCKYIRVKLTGWGGKIEAIGNLMEDKWFSFDDFFSE